MITIEADLLELTNFRDPYYKKGPLLEIPEQGEIEEIESWDTKIFTLKVASFMERAILTDFIKIPHVYCPRSIPTVCITPNDEMLSMETDFYMLWIKEREEWVGVKFSPAKHKPINIAFGEETRYVPPRAEGPYKLNQDFAELILEAYDNTRTPLEKVLHTSPSLLKPRKPFRSHYYVVVYDPKKD
jgi:hypothetical protein